MNDTDLLITIGTAFVMALFIFLWMIAANATVTFIGAVVAILVIVWMARLGIDNDE